MSVDHDGVVLDNSSSGFVTGVGAFFATMYFIQGVGDPTSGLIAQPVRSLLKSWGDSPTTIAAFMGLLALPWSLKVLFGLLSDLVPLHVEFQIYRALLESIASEFGARMSAMDSATKNASEMISSLTLQFNRARQAAITKELMEIIGGAEALKG